MDPRIRVIKSRIMRLTGYVGCVETRNSFTLIRRKCKGKSWLVDVVADDRIIIERIFNKWD
jgi:hypothetical protein